MLTPAEADHLFRILQHLKAEGKTIILITHKLREIMAVTDAVSVMRRGEMVKTLVTAETSPAELAELMVGRRVLLRVEKAPAKPGEVLLEVENLGLVDAKGVERLRSVSFALRAGEILGVAGVAGNGQSELLEVLAGIRPATGGTVRHRGAPLALDSITNADDRRDAGIAHIPEDRHRRGLVMPFDEWESSCLGYQHEERFRGPALTLDRTAIRDVAREAIEQVRRAAAVLRPEDRQLLGRQPAEDRDRARDGARPGRAAGRPADARRRHRRDRVHPPADRGAARPRQGDPAGLGRARRDPGAAATGSS